ncbi:hypothetical protein HPB51_016537 [Rhipicephalus microplus]|uniref:Uncharacterized protein n=1 Tax=Rhipicephalus microplus TaxID=6941 RepID=A0A9J6EHM2_RHIMP|nr:hypothetical protein HPB51_016537 [Rhipicephalus microplus]
MQVRWRDKGLFKATLIAISDLDGYLKSAEALFKELKKGTSCQSRGEAEEEKRGAAKKMGAIDRPAVLKRIVSATLPTSADAREPQRTCDPHHESPDPRVTPHLQAEKEQGPCLASRTSSCSPACPAEEDRPVYSCSPAGPSSKPGSGTATQLLFCWSDPDVVELQPGSSIFVETRALHAVLKSAKTPTALARGLLPAVFNRHSLLTCSMKRQKAKGTHKPVAQRPPLYAAAIDAILGKPDLVNCGACSTDCRYRIGSGIYAYVVSRQIVTQAP